MKSLKISVVTVCYNAVESIEETILSVLDQTYPDVEYIIIDGGSKDGTVDIIKKYANRLAYWITEPDKGIYDAMNKGINIATGDYINFMNAGDRFSQFNILDSFSELVSKDADVIYGDVIIKYKGKFLRRKPLHLNKFISTQPFCHQSSFVKLQLLKKCLFDTSLRIAADYNFFYRCYSEQKSFQYVPIAISIYDSTNGVSTDSLPELMNEKFKIWGIENNWVQKLPWKMVLGLYQLKYHLKKLLPANVVVLLKKTLDKTRSRSKK